MANPKMVVEVISKQTMNVNVSHSFVNTLGAIMDVLGRDYYAKDTTRLTNEENYSPYWLINDCGSPITVWTEEVPIYLPSNLANSYLQIFQSQFEVRYGGRVPVIF